MGRVFLALVFVLLGLSAIFGFPESPMSSRVTVAVICGITALLALFYPRGES